MAVGDEIKRLLAGPRLSSVATPPAQLGSLFDAAMTGFFRAAAAGQTFTDPALIEKQFGRTLEQNYPEAGKTFLQFAYSYWTLKLVVTEASADARSTLAHQLLAQIEQMVAGLFFPTPGPVRIDPAQREAAQRQTLQQSGAAIDIEDFILHNPILLRDRAARRSGCLALVGALSAAGVTMLRLLST